MSKEEARRKRDMALRRLKAAEAELAEIDGIQEDSDVIDAEIVSEEETVESNRLPVVLEVKSHEGEKPLKPERDWPYGPTPERRCRAHSTRTGEPCKNAALQGSTVCRFHGGAAKHVKAAARARLENAADRMARNLLGLAEEADSSAVRLGATNSALDRVGITKPTEVVLSPGSAKPYEEVFDDISAGLTRAESRRQRGCLEDTGLSSPGTRDSSDSNTSSFDAGLEAEQPASSDSCEHNVSMSSRDAPLGQPPGEPLGREAHAERPVRHISGDDAWRIAGQLTRQKELESPHKRYPRP
jgi:hypothetical protein